MKNKSFNIEKSCHGLILYRQEAVALIRPSSRAGDSSFQSKYVLPELIYLL